MTVQISAEHTGATTLEQTYAMLTDEGFYALLRSSTPGAEQISLAIDRDRGDVEWVQRLPLPNDVPATARRVIGSHLVLREAQAWEAPSPPSGAAKIPVSRVRTARVRITPEGLPAQMLGTYEIREPEGDSGRCRVLISGTVSVDVPLLGRSLESLIAENFLRAVQLRDDAARAWAGGGP